jgi:murein hydrolase activator
MNPNKLFYFLSTLLFISLVNLGYSQSKFDLLKQKQQLLKEIENTNRILSETEHDKRASVKELKALNGQIQSRQKLIQTINSQVHNLDYEITDNKSNVSNLQNNLVRLKKEYANTIRFAYLNQGAYQRLSFVFSSSSFIQGYKRLKSLEQFTNYRLEQVNAIQNAQDKLNNKIKILDKNLVDKSKMLSEEQKQKVQLDKVKVVQSQKVSELQTQSKDLQKRLSQALRKKARLDNAIQSAIRKEIEEARIKAQEEEKAREASNLSAGKAIPKNARSSENLTLTPEAAKLSNDFLDNKGRLPWPVERRGKLLESFGVYRDPVQTKVMHDSKGISFEVANNASVRAVFTGTVSNILSLGGTYAILVGHGEYFTVYSNLASVSVHKGEKINTKQIIGQAASDPDDGSTCQFSIYKGKVPLNPESWLAN